MDSKVARKLVFHNALVFSLKSTYVREKSFKSRRVLGSVLMNKLILHYRLQNRAAKALGLAAKKRFVAREVVKQRVLHDKIRNFFLSDEVSRVTAGIKETVTFKKVKKQKSYLDDSMKTLYKAFLKENGPIISYTTFTRNRPFYVVKPSDINRDTCLCKVHANIQLKTMALKQNKVIEEKNPHELTNLIVCDKSSAACMYGQCNECNKKIIPVSVDNPTESASWYEWQTVNQTKTKNIAGIQQVKEVKVSARVKIDGTIGELVDKFQTDMKSFKVHIFNVKKQNEAYKYIRENLKPEEAVIHIDFSENYACKLAEEIQSFHFGSSRNQATLHTGVVYLQNRPNPICFASVSSSRSHEPPAIWAHLKPVLSFLQKDFPSVKTTFFL